MGEVSVPSFIHYGPAFHDSAGSVKRHQWLDLAYNRDDPYAMGEIHQKSQPHENLLWKPEAIRLTLNLEEKLLCPQLC
jgi:hypothetical protein